MMQAAQRAKKKGNELEDLTPKREKPPKENLANNPETIVAYCGSWTEALPETFLQPPEYLTSHEVPPETSSYHVKRAVEGNSHTQSTSYKRPPSVEIDSVMDNMERWIEGVHVSPCCQVLDFIYEQSFNLPVRILQEERDESPLIKEPRG